MGVLEQMHMCLEKELKGKKIKNMFALSTYLGYIVR